MLASNPTAFSYVGLLTCFGVFCLCSAKMSAYPHPSRQEVLQRHQLNHVLRGSWKSVDLSTHNALIKDLESYIKGKSQDVSEGHSGEVVIERKLYYALANMSSINHICEIGLNGGHSAAMWLLANTHATVTMFDLFSHDYAKSAVEYLTSDKAAAQHGLVDAPKRLRVFAGNSLHTLPKFAAENPHFRCDLLSVDGGHTFDVAVADIKNMRNLANPAFNVLVVDDTNCMAGYCVDDAVVEHEKRGTIHVLQSFSENMGVDGYLRGVTVAEYIR